VTVRAGNMGILNTTCKLMCLWGGMISITSPGQFTTNNS
jgi:hypothetical protein